MKSLLWTIWILYLFEISNTRVNGEESIADKVSKILDGLFSKYDKRITPNYGKGPLKIEMSAYILDMYDIDEGAHDFTTQLYFRQHWVDERLTFKPLPGMDMIMLNAEQSSKIWTPDTFCVNERSSVHHSLTSPNELTRISADGSVLKSIRLTIKAACKMDLKWFPFDSQLCTLNFESYGFTASQFYYTWKEKKGSIGVSDEASSSLKFKVKAFNEKEVYVSLKTGNYSRVAIEFFLVRQPARFLQDCYFPATVLTILSFLTLWIGSPENRLKHSLIIMMTMFLFMIINTSAMPKVYYQTALDAYIFMCANFIINAVLANYMLFKVLEPKRERIAMQLQARRQNSGNCGGRRDEMKEGLYPADGPEDYPDDQFNEGSQLSSRFDEILFLLFGKSKYTLPILFFLAFIIYWMAVLIGSSGFPEDFILTEDHGN